MVTPAFGFSVGDFIAAIELVGKVAKALRETDGASTRYQQAAAEIDRIHLVLRKVQALKSSGENSDIIDKVHVCSLACHIPLSRFIDNAKKFEVHLAYHGDQNGPSRTIKKQLKRSGRKVQWTLILEKELEKLKASIAPQLQTIDLLLQLEALERFEESRNTQKEIETDAKALLGSVDDLKTLMGERMPPRVQTTFSQMSLGGMGSVAVEQQSEVVVQSAIDQLHSRFIVQENMLKRIMTQLPSSSDSRPCIMPMNSGSRPQVLDGVLERSKCSQGGIALRIYSFLLYIRNGLTEIIVKLLCLFPAIQKFSRTLMGFTRAPTLLLEDSIYLEDALGRMMTLPYEHFRYWEVLEARLRVSFARLPGEAKVYRNQFHILNMRASASGVVVTRKAWNKMVFPGSRLAMSILVTETNLFNRACPRCHFIDEISMQAVWTTCTACRLQIIVLQPERKHKTLSGTVSVIDELFDGVKDRASDKGYIALDREEIEGPEADPDSELQHFKRVHLIESQKQAQRHFPARATTGNSFQSYRKPYDNDDADDADELFGSQDPRGWRTEEVTSRRARIYNVIDLASSVFDKVTNYLGGSSPSSRGEDIEDGVHWWGTWGGGGGERTRMIRLNRGVTSNALLPDSESACSDDEDRS